MKSSSLLWELFLEVLMVPLALALASAAAQPAAEALRAANQAIHAGWKASAGNALVEAVRRGCPCAAAPGRE